MYMYVLYQYNVFLLQKNYLHYFHAHIQSSEAGLSSAQRAFHPKEVTKQQLKVDMHYYLQSQVLLITVEYYTYNHIEIIPLYGVYT